MSSPAEDRQLLLAALALQMGLVGQEALVDAVRAWALDRERPPVDLLALSAEQRAALERAAERHLARHGGDAADSLVSLPGTPDVTTDVVGDSDGRTTAAGAGASRFRVLKPHAAGGLGEVSVALDQELGREVALKQLRGEHADDAGSRARFLREAEITSRLEHPGIVPVYGMDADEGGRPRYAMRFVRGESLHEAIRRFHDADAGRRDPAERALALRGLLRRFVDVCNAIGYAHSRGVIHRDIKPANVMLGEYGETLVVDWGLAKVVEDPDGETRPHRAVAPTVGGGEPTRVGQAVGTPAFMPPEQARGEAGVGPAADVWALGATLYCVLTGQPPYRGRREEVQERAARAEVEPARRVNPRVPAALDAVCARAMAARPADRYAGPKELAGDVERWLADEPVNAHRDPIAARAWRWAKRNRTATAAAAVLLLLAVPLAVALALVSDGARRQTEVARQNAVEGQKNADRLADRRRKMSEFYASYVLAAPRPRDPDSAHDIGMKKALDKALPKITEVFAGEPEDELAVRRTVGETYLALGDTATAVTQLRRARELSEKLHGPKARATLEVVTGLAQALVLEGKGEEAFSLFEAGYQAAKEAHGPEDELTTLFRENEAVALIYEGKHARAEEILREVLPVRRRVHGHDSLQALSTESQLADLLERQGKSREAEPLWHSVVRRLEKMLGRDHAETLINAAGWAFTLVGLGQPQKAEEELTRLLPRMDRVLGPEHIATDRCRHNIACCMFIQGKYLEAEKPLREVIAIRRARSPDHPALLRSESVLVQVLSGQGRADDAEALWRTVEEKYRRVRGPNHPESLDALRGWAVALARLGRPGKAEAAFTDLVSRCGATLGPNHPYTLECQGGLAGALLSQGKFGEAAKMLKPIADAQEKNAADDLSLAITRAALGWALSEAGQAEAAESQLRQSLEVRKKRLPQGNWRVANGESLLGGALLAQKKYAQAEPLLLSGYEGLLATKGYPPARLPEAHARVLRLYTDWGKPDKAAEWQKNKPPADKKDK